MYRRQRTTRYKFSNCGRTDQAAKDVSDLISFLYLPFYFARFFLQMVPINVTEFILGHDWDFPTLDGS